MSSTDTDVRRDVDVDAIGAREGVLPTPTSSGLGRPLLDMDDLDACPEWDLGRKALMAFVTELNLPSAGSDSSGSRPAQWLNADVVISVQLVYGNPVIAFERGFRRTTVPLAQADRDDLLARAHGGPAPLQQ